jgi:hypothetical protein
MHLLLLQISVARQAVAHPPQWAGSVAVSTQRTGVPHIACVVTAPQGWHVPPTQLAVMAQAVPHPPQLFPSLFKSAQTALAPVPHTS